MEIIQSEAECCIGLLCALFTSSICNVQNYTAFLRCFHQKYFEILQISFNSKLIIVRFYTFDWLI